MNTCPVCGYSKMTHPPRDFYICPCCGTEFENDDFETTHEDLRAAWRAKGMPWFSRATPPPLNWNPYQQLLEAGFGYSATTVSAEVKVAMVDLGKRDKAFIANNGSFTASVRERVIALGHAVPNLSLRARSASA